MNFLRHDAIGDTVAAITRCCSMKIHQYGTTTGSTGSPKKCSAECDSALNARSDVNTTYMIQRVTEGHASPVATTLHTTSTFALGFDYAHHANTRDAHKPHEPLRSTATNCKRMHAAYARETRSLRTREWTHRHEHDSSTFTTCKTRRRPWRASKSTLKPSAKGRR